MAETTPRSSVLYALGRLDAKVEDHAKAIEAIPQQVAAIINPRLVALEATSSDYGRRIHSLERRQWLWLGGGTVLVVLSGYAIQFVFPVHHLALLHP